MKYGNCKAVAVERELVKGLAPNRGVAEVKDPGECTVSVLVPVSMADMPFDFLTRKVTLVFDPTPGEAAHAVWREWLGKYSAAWSELSREQREHWESVAIAAKRAG